MAATCWSPLSITGVGQSSAMKSMWSSSSTNSLFLKTPKRIRAVKGISAEYGEGDRGGGGVDFLAGFVVGGALCGTLAYIFAPQIRRSLLNEDEYGFRRARKPIYYDEGLERTRQTLNEKISQLNSAIDNVSSRLRGANNNSSAVPLEADPEVEATM